MVIIAVNWVTLIYDLALALTKDLGDRNEPQV